MFIYDSEFKTDKCEMIAKGFEETNSSGGGGYHRRDFSNVNCICSPSQGPWLVNTG